MLAGHLHEQVGPTATTGANGKVGYSYTNGTTGGAAYALAIGSKLRRDAEVTLVTYRDGVPVGLQPVVVDTHRRVPGRGVRRPGAHRAHGRPDPAPSGSASP